MDFAARWGEMARWFLSFLIAFGLVVGIFYGVGFLLRWLDVFRALGLIFSVAVGLATWAVWLRLPAIKTHLPRGLTGRTQHSVHPK